MNHRTILFIFFIFLPSFLSAQVYFPNRVSDTQRGAKITRVVKGKDRTKIDFIYTSKEKDTGRYIFLSPPNSRGAYFIRANNKKYSLLYTRGIAKKDGETIAYYNKPITFSAYFDPIPSYTTKFDLIEGTDGSWHFYNVKLTKPTYQQVQKGKEARKKAFELGETMTKDFQETGKWDFLYLKLAQESIEEAIANGVHDYEALFLYGWFYYLERKPQKAIENFNYALLFYPNDDHFHLHLGNSYYVLDDLGTAKYYWNKSDTDKAREMLRKY